MTRRFDYFILLAEMRTGSNFLESNLNAFDGIGCHGEAFNPHFIGYPHKTEILGVTQAMRDADPAQLIRAVKQAPGIGGFRFFHDHDPRALEIALADPRCAKIVLTRNPLESYVSWKIAKATNQWKLTDVKRRKQAQAEFDAEEFARHVATLQGFQVTLMNRLQSSGQTAFYVAYEDLQDLGVMNGLAAWLGCDARLEALDDSLKVQNPAPLTDKVSNPDQMQAALAGMDWFNLSRTPNFEPRRGAAVPSYVGGGTTPLLYLPIPGGPVDSVAAWLAALDGVSEAELHRKMTQKTLRKWKRSMPGHRSFTVLRHPAARIHSVFCQKILSTGPGSYLKIRQTLNRQFGLNLPEGDPDQSYSLASHRAAFEGFLTFVKANLAGQTALRVDGTWCSQSQALSSFGDFALPDHVLREDELAELLPDLARRVGHAAPPAWQADDSPEPYPLADIYDDALEALIADVYNRDYVMFGFQAWGRPPEAAQPRR